MDGTMLVRFVAFFAAVGVIAYVVAVAEGIPVRRGRGIAMPDARSLLLAPLGAAAKALTDQRAPRRPARQVLARVAPWIAPLTWAVSLALVPVIPGHAVVGAPAAGLLLLVCLTLGGCGPVLLGLSAAHRLAGLAAVRAAQQVIVVWLPLALSLTIPMLLAGTLDLNVLAARWQWWWGIALLPVTAVYVLAAAALLHRAPFAAPRARELDAHYLAGCTGGELAVHRFGEVLGLAAVSVIGAALLLGGWAGPGAGVVGWLWLGLKSSLVLAAVLAVSAVPGRIDTAGVLRFGRLLTFVAAGLAAVVALGMWWS